MKSESNIMSKSVSERERQKRVQQRNRQDRLVLMEPDEPSKDDTASMFGPPTKPEAPQMDSIAQRMLSLNGPWETRVRLAKDRERRKERSRKDELASGSGTAGMTSSPAAAPAADPPGKGSTHSSPVVSVTSRSRHSNNNYPTDPVDQLTGRVKDTHIKREVFTPPPTTSSGMVPPPEPVTVASNGSNNVLELDRAAAIQQREKTIKPSIPVDANRLLDSILTTEASCSDQGASKSGGPRKITTSTTATGSSYGNNSSSTVMPCNDRSITPTKSKASATSSSRHHTSSSTSPVNGSRRSPSSSSSSHHRRDRDHHHGHHPQDHHRGTSNARDPSRHRSRSPPRSASSSRDHRMSGSSRHSSGQQQQRQRSAERRESGSSRGSRGGRDSTASRHDAKQRHRRESPPMPLVAAPATKALPAIDTSRFDAPLDLLSPLGGDHRRHEEVGDAITSTTITAAAAQKLAQRPDTIQVPPPVSRASLMVTEAQQFVKQWTSLPTPISALDAQTPASCDAVNASESKFSFPVNIPTQLPAVHEQSTHCTSASQIKTELLFDGDVSLETTLPYCGGSEDFDPLINLSDSKPVDAHFDDFEDNDEDNIEKPAQLGRQPRLTEVLHDDLAISDSENDDDCNDTTTVVTTDDHFDDLQSADFCTSFHPQPPLLANNHVIITNDEPLHLFGDLLTVPKCELDLSISDNSDCAPCFVGANEVVLGDDEHEEGEITDSEVDLPPPVALVKTEPVVPVSSESSKNQLLRLVQEQSADFEHVAGVDAELDAINRAALAKARRREKKKLIEQQRRKEATMSPAVSGRSPKKTPRPVDADGADPWSLTELFKNASPATVVKEEVEIKVIKKSKKLALHRDLFGGDSDEDESEMEEGSKLERVKAIEPVKNIPKVQKISNKIRSDQTKSKTDNHKPSKKQSLTETVAAVKKSNESIHNINTLPGVSSRLCVVTDFPPVGAKPPPVKLSPVPPKSEDSRPKKQKTPRPATPSGKTASSIIREQKPPAPFLSPLLSGGTDSESTVSPGRGKAPKAAPVSRPDVTAPIVVKKEPKNVVTASKKVSNSSAVPSNNMANSIITSSSSSSEKKSKDKKTKSSMINATSRRLDQSASEKVQLKSPVKDLVRHAPPPIVQVTPATPLPPPCPPSSSSQLFAGGVHGGPSPVSTSTAGTATSIESSKTKLSSQQQQPKVEKLKIKMSTVVQSPKQRPQQSQISKSSNSNSKKIKSSKEKSAVVADRPKNDRSDDLKINRQQQHKPRSQKQSSGQDVTLQRASPIFTSTPVPPAFDDADDVPLDRRVSEASTSRSGSSSGKRKRKVSTASTDSSASYLNSTGHASASASQRRVTPSPNRLVLGISPPPPVQTSKHLTIVSPHRSTVSHVAHGMPQKLSPDSTSANVPLRNSASSSDSSNFSGIQSSTNTSLPYRKRAFPVAVAESPGTTGPPSLRAIDDLTASTNEDEIPNDPPPKLPRQDMTPGSAGAPAQPGSLQVPDYMRIAPNAPTYCDISLPKPDVYLGKARLYKHEADLQKDDKMMKLLLYCESTVHFLMCAIVVERTVPQQSNRPYSLISESIAMLKDIVERYSKLVLQPPEIARKVYNLGHRLIGISYKRLYSMRRHRAQVNEVQLSAHMKRSREADSQLKVQQGSGSQNGNGMAGNRPGTASGGASSGPGGGSSQRYDGGSHTGGTPSSTPSPASSTGSQSCFPSDQVGIPKQLDDLYRSQIHILNNLYWSDVFWTQTFEPPPPDEDNAFYERLDQLCGRLTVDTPLEDMFAYIVTGLAWLKNMLPRQRNMTSSAQQSQHSIQTSLGSGTTAQTTARHYTGSSLAVS